MNPLEIAIMIGAIALVGFTIVFNIIRKRKGKNSCGCSSCDGCKSRAECKAKKAR